MSCINFLIYSTLIFSLYASACWFLSIFFLVFPTNFGILLCFVLTIAPLLQFFMEQFSSGIRQAVDVKDQLIT